jgi:hypothetical protein
MEESFRNAESLSESITRIVEDKNDFYRSSLHTLTDRGKVILVLLELYSVVIATQSVWPNNDIQEPQSRLLDEIHTAAFALLREKGLVTDASAFEALAQKCHARWNSACDKGKNGQSPSSFYWLAKDVLITIRPDQNPDIAVIDGLADYLTHDTAAWVHRLRSGDMIPDAIGKSASSSENDLSTLEGRMVAALWTQTRIGPNDEVANHHDGGIYWVSTCRFPGAGWQTSVFDRRRILWLMRPFFRINDMESPFGALLNHCTAIIVVAETEPRSWPKGMKWSQSSDSSWLEARAKITTDQPDENDPAGIVRFYSTLRSQYQCIHRM